MKFQVSNLFRKKEEPVENNAVETAEAQVAGEAPKAEPVTEQTAAAAEEEVTVCPKCKQEFKKSAIKDNYNVCIACGYHYVVSAEKRVRLLVDPGTFKPLRCKVAFSNPLDMPEYEEKIERLQEKTGLEEAVYTGVGKIDGNEAVIAVMSSKFLMGSMGMAVGEKGYKCSGICRQETSSTYYIYRKWRCAYAGGYFISDADGEDKCSD